MEKRVPEDKGRVDDMGNCGQKSRIPCFSLTREEGRNAKTTKQEYERGDKRSKSNHHESIGNAGRHHQVPSLNCIRFLFSRKQTK